MMQVKNLSRRLVSFSGNSGPTWYIPPGMTIELEDFELSDNAKVRKLTERRLLDVRRSVKKEPEAGSEERERAKRARPHSASSGRTQHGD